MKQEETYQKQLMKIFSSENDEAISGTPRSDVNDARTADKLANKGY